MMKVLEVLFLQIGKAKCYPNWMHLNPKLQAKDTQKSVSLHTFSIAEPKELEQAGK